MQLSKRIGPLSDSLKAFSRFNGPDFFGKFSVLPDICDFAYGNSQNLPLPELTEALRKAVAPEHKDWFVYRTRDPQAQSMVAQSLSAYLKHEFEPDDILLTNGAFGGLATALATILDPDDKVIVLSPYWFFYPGIILNAGGSVIEVPVDSRTFELDINAIRDAIDPTVKAIIINTPHNPTGKVYSHQCLKQLAEMLCETNKRLGKTIFLISDESFNRIVFSGATHISPTLFYPYSILVYTFGKTLMAPGERLGYNALPKSMPDREKLRQAMYNMQYAVGYTFPNTSLLHAFQDINGLSVDVGRIERRRNKLCDALEKFGYEVSRPQGTFYVILTSPIEDDWRFGLILAESGVLAMPGTVVGLPGKMRLSLTANDDMVERSLPMFQQALQKAQTENSLSL